MNDLRRDSPSPLALIIEDDVSQANLLVRKLELEGFQVFACHQVGEALRLSKLHRFAVAIVDLDLGGESGLEFVRSISSQRSKTKVILHSIEATFLAAKEGLNLGVFAFVEKGRDDHQLIDFCHRAANLYLSEILDAANDEIAFQLGLLAAVEQGILATDKTGTLTYWNSFSERLTGILPSQVLGRSLHSLFLFSLQDLQTVREQIWSGGNWEGYAQIKRYESQSNPIDVKLTISKLNDSQGNRIGSVVSYHDVTNILFNERTLVRRAQLLAVSAEIGRLAVDSSDQNAFLTDVIKKIDDVFKLGLGRVLLVDPSRDSFVSLPCINRESNITVGDANLREVESLSPNETIDGFRMHFYDNRDMIGCIECEFESSIQLSPERIDFLQSAASFVEAVILRNRSTNLKKSLFENSLDAVLVARHDGRFVDSNSVASEMLGYSRDEFLGLSFSNIISSEKSKTSPHFLADLIETGELRGEFELSKKDNSIVLVEFLAAANILPGVHIAHLRDITRKKQSEKLILEQQDQLNHLQRTATMGEMAAVLAHEINQPLGAISNYSGGLLYGLNKGTFPPMGELTETLNLICNESLKAGDIVNRLRRFITRVPLNTQRFDLNNSIRDALRILKNLISNNNVTVHSDLMPDLPLAEVDPIRIQQVLVNVFKNSIEAISVLKETQKIIKVTTCQIGNCTHISIVDNGPLLEASVFEKLFQPYQTSKATGLGMGLCISRSIVEQHHGTIKMIQLVPNGMKTVLCIPTSIEMQKR